MHFTGQPINYHAPSRSSYAKIPVRKKDGDILHLNHLFTHTHRLHYGLICFPITEDSGKTYLPKAFSPQLGSDFHHFSTYTGSHLSRLSVMFEKGYCLRPYHYFLKSTTFSYTLSTPCSTLFLLNH